MQRPFARIAQLSRHFSFASATSAKGFATSAAPASSFVKQTIDSNPVVVFSKTYCPYCSKAKRVLTAENAKFVTIELDTRKDGDQIQDELLKLVKRRSVPAVFVGAQYIGGGDDTEALHVKGELKKLLKNAGALE